MNPFEVFRKRYKSELEISKASIPSGCCLATVGLDNYPNARFVSLKDFTDDVFIISKQIS